MALVVLRFQLNESGIPDRLSNLLGFPAVLSLAQPTEMVELTVNDVANPDGVAVATEVFTDFGWTLVATDPANTVTDAAREAFFGVQTVRETDGPADLTMGALLDGQVIARVGTNLVGRAQQLPPMLFGAASVAGNTQARFLFPGNADSTAPTSAIQIAMPRAGVLRNLFLRVSTPGGNGNAVVYTVRVNETPSPLTVSLASTGAQGSDVTNSIAVAQGDRVDIEVTKAVGVGVAPQQVVAALELVAA